ncbi:MAG: hypothetical protein OXF47_03490 [Nitrospira sp.]|nr:hypothetical protein [Nitrospira sp.]
MSYASAIISDLELVHADEEDHNGIRETTQWSRAFSIFNLNRKRIKALKSLLELGSLPEDWDSYGSPPPTEYAMDTGCSFIVNYLSDEDPMPWVSPVSGGGIQLSWKKQANELNLDILPDGRMEFLKSSDSDPIEVDEKFSLDGLKIQSMLDWVR